MDCMWVALIHDPAKLACSLSYGRSHLTGQSSHTEIYEVCKLPLDHLGCHWSINLQQRMD